MPFTLSHPAAILPLRRIAGRQLVFPALIIGSLTPDAGYFVNQLAFADYAHTPLGSVLACIPVGLALFALFMWLRGPLASTLPNPHRDALLPLCSSPWPGVVIISGSLLIGAWTHILWDSFTHQDGWIVVRVPMLSYHIASIGSYHLCVYRLLQHVSTLAGLSVLAYCYLRWLRKTTGTLPLFMREEKTWYFLWLGTFAFPALYVLFRSHRRGKELVEMVQPGMIFESVVMYIAVFSTLVILLGIVMWGRKKLAGP